MLGGCYRLFSVGGGGGQTYFLGERIVEAADVLVPDGYHVEVVATGLTFPTGLAFDSAGVPFVTEAGYSYGWTRGTPRLMRITAGGRTEVVAIGDNPPWNGVDYHDGAFYVAGGHHDGGQILRITPAGDVVTVVDALPSAGDHHTNGPRVGPDGYLYFGQGTATNAGVVGVDNHEFGWLERNPGFHDLPCRDVKLTGRNYRSPNPIGEDGAYVETGAFVPFGQRTEPGQVLPGTVPCSGAVMRVLPSGGEIHLLAWGFRNPFGLAFDPEGTLYVSDNGFDDRGSRPAWGASDFLWRVEEDTWYGWPDFAGGVPLSRFKPPGKSRPQFVLSEHPDAMPRPAVRFGVHSSSNGFDFSHSESFGHVGDAFVAQFGDMAPGVGHVVDPVGFRVVRVDVKSGVVYGFAENRTGHGPASYSGGTGFERPIAARFSPDGSALYVVDFGVMTTNRDGPQPRPGTGTLWRISRRAP